MTNFGALWPVSKWIRACAGSSSLHFRGYMNPALDWTPAQTTPVFENLTMCQVLKIRHPTYATHNPIQYTLGVTTALLSCHNWFATDNLMVLYIYNIVWFIPRTSKACKNIALSELCDIFLKRHFFWLRALFHFKMVELIFQKLTVYMSLIAPTDLLSSRECYLISFAPFCVAWYCQ